MAQRSILAGILLGFAGIGSSFAQSDPGAAGATDTADEGAQLAEVVVTAQKRVERLQDVPISAQVISGQALAEQNQNSLDNLSQTLADVHINSDGPNSDMYIRGIGSGGYESVDQSVAMFVDDIYHGRSRLSSATFLDLERIEVLKGPQSTFFGNNAIAGAVNMITRKPGDTLDASFRALYGMFGQYAAEGAIGGPMTPGLGVRVAATANGYNRGWIDNVNLGTHVPTVHNLAGRATFLLHPNESFDATLKIEGSNNKVSNGGWGAQPVQVVNCPPPPGIPLGYADGNCAVALAQGVPLGLQNNSNAEEAGQYTKMSTLEDVLTINLRRWGQTFTSVSGYSAYHFDENQDGDGVPQYLITSQLPEHYHQFSQELRVASPADQRVEYLAGLYYQTDYTAIGKVDDYPFLNAIIPQIPPFAPLVPYLPLGRNIYYTQDEDVYSLFGSVTWKVVEKLKVHAGLRGSWVKKDFTQTIGYGMATQNYGGLVPLPPNVAALPAAFGLGPPGTVSGSRNDRAVMPSAGIQYQLDPRVMAYVSYARGFKAGGFNSDDTTGVPSSLAFGPEHVHAYEVGLKSTWLQDRVLLNLDAFRSDYSGLQVASFVELPGGVNTLAVRNAASSRAQGVEFEGQLAPSRNFRLQANVAYVDSHYTSYPNADPSVFTVNPGAYQDLSGKQTLFAPRWSGSISATYRLSLPGGFALTAIASPYFSSSYYLHQTDEPQFQQKQYTRLDARLTLESPDRKWALDLIGQNLTDKVIITSFAGPFTASKAIPRNVAAQVRYHW
jgi:outer membrane receptor protein involved in Fe transport